MTTTQESGSQEFAPQGLAPGDRAPRSSGARPGPGRRAVVVAVGAAGAVAALTACGDSGDSGTGGKAGTVLGRTSDVPEGGGRVFADQGVVVTQPTMRPVQGLLRHLHPSGLRGERGDRRRHHLPVSPVDLRSRDG